MTDRRAIDDILAERQLCSVSWMMRIALRWPASSEAGQLQLGAVDLLARGDPLAASSTLSLTGGSGCQS